MCRLVCFFVETPYTSRGRSPPSLTFFFFIVSSRPFVSWSELTKSFPFDRWPPLRLAAGRPVRFRSIVVFQQEPIGRFVLGFIWFAFLRSLSFSRPYLPDDFGRSTAADARKPTNDNGGGGDVQRCGLENHIPFRQAAVVVIRIRFSNLYNETAALAVGTRTFPQCTGRWEGVNTSCNWKDDWWREHEAEEGRVVGPPRLYGTYWKSERAAARP